MTLDEVIESLNDNNVYEIEIKCGQLAEWFTELKEWRRVYGVCPSYEMCIPECKEGYNAQMAEYKRLLKAAVEDIEGRSADKCKGCIYENASGKEKYVNCTNFNCYKWRYADEALKLIGNE